MTCPSKSTIAQLRFLEPPVFNFVRLVNDLNGVLNYGPYADHILAWDHDDVVFFDIQGLRITLGYAAGLTGEFEACLIVSVGPAPDWADKMFVPDDNETLCQQIAQRIASKLQPAEMVWQEWEGVMTSELIDTITETLPERAGIIETIPEQAEITESRPEQTKTSHLSAAPDPADLIRIAEQTEQIFEQRFQKHWEPAAAVTAAPRKVRKANAARTVKPAPVPEPEVANDMPDLPRPQLTDAQRIREALYSTEPENEKPTAALRLSAHAINATIVVLSLPIGASLVTYSLLRGENVNVSARAMALCGILIGLQQTPIGQQAMSLI